MSRSLANEFYEVVNGVYDSCLRVLRANGLLAQSVDTSLQQDDRDHHTFKSGQSQYIG